MSWSVTTGWSCVRSCGTTSASCARPSACSAPCTACRRRSEEHTSELQSLMRISYAVFCLKKKKKQREKIPHHIVEFYYTRHDLNKQRLRATQMHIQNQRV